MEIFFWITGFFAAFLGNIAAFGINSILLPVAVSIFPFETALALTSIFHMFGNFGRIGFFREELDRRIFILFGSPNIIFTFLGASLVGEFPETILKSILGVILVLYSILGLTGKELRFESKRVYLIIGGSIYGFFSGLVGSGGPLRGAMLSSFGLTGGVYVSTNGGISFLTDVTRVSVYLWNRYLPQDFYLYVPLLFIVAITVGYFSKIAVKRLKTRQFKLVIHLAVLLASFKIIWGALIPLNKFFY
jgi:hypothetical protein